MSRTCVCPSFSRPPPLHSLFRFPRRSWLRRTKSRSPKMGSDEVIRSLESLLANLDEIRAQATMMLDEATKKAPRLLLQWRSASSQG